MAENIKERFSTLGDRLKHQRSEMGKMVNTGMATVSEKMKELFNRPSTPAGKLVEELTRHGEQEEEEEAAAAAAEAEEDEDWAKSMELCDLLNQDKANREDAVKALKRRIVAGKNPRQQLLALTLMETCVRNCDKIFFEISSHNVLDDMVKLVDDPSTPRVNRDKALKLLETWGDSSHELRRLPKFGETYKSLRSRGVRFPLRDSESLAPLFTPPKSSTLPSETNHAWRQSNENLIGRHEDLDFPPDIFDVLGTAQTMDLFDTARNCVDLLTTVLTSSPQNEALQDELTLALVEQCHQSQFVVQRIVEQAGDNELLLFEALNVNDELQKALSKYEEMKVSLLANSNWPSLSPSTMSDSHSCADSEACVTSTTSISNEYTNIKESNALEE